MLAAQVKILPERAHEFDVELNYRDMIETVFACGRMTSGSFEHLQEVLASMRRKSSGFITGKSEMTKLDIHSLHKHAEPDLRPSLLP